MDTVESCGKTTVVEKTAPSEKAGPAEMNVAPVVKVALVHKGFHLGNDSRISSEGQHDIDMKYANNCMYLPALLNESRQLLYFFEFC